MADALGMIECRSFAATVEAADAMVKAANVQIGKRVEIGGGLVTVLVSGDVGSVRAAVDAGSRVADQIGECLGSHVIANPAEGVVDVFLK